MRLYMDEDSTDGDFVASLRRAGFDVVTCVEVNRLSFSDTEQLEFASSEHRVIVTANRGDFAALHARNVGAGNGHSGIVLWRQFESIGDRVRGLRRLASENPDGIADRLEYLSEWIRKDRDA